MRNLFLLLIPAIFFALPSNGQQPADVIYFNAKIWTGDTAHPAATAIAIRDSLIQYVGNDFQSYQGTRTKLLDLQGKMLVPGFIDNHVHFLQGGYDLASIDLRQVKSKQAFVAIVDGYADSLTGDGWIQGGNWDHEAWGGVLPSKEWIDSVSRQHPVFLSRYDGHMALVNTIVLKKLGISRSTPNPPGGEIVKDPKTGEPTGILRDAATRMVENIIAKQSPEQLAEDLKRACAYALSHGFTQVHDMGSYRGWLDLATYQRAEAAGMLPIRIYSFVPLATWQKLDSFVHKNGKGDSRLHWGGLKAFADGSLGSTTAWFFQPYLDAPNSTGLQVTDTNLLRQWIEAADAAQLQIATHAIGDRANDFVLDVYQEAEEKNPVFDRRFRIEHAQHLLKKDIARFHQLGVTPSMQPMHLVDDGNWAAKRLDSGRLRGTYAFRSLLSTNAGLTFGSDWPVAPLDPIAGIYAAVTRRTTDGNNPAGWFPDQKISVEQALRCYTVNNARAGFMEKTTGQLKAGMLADFTVLSQDLFTIPPDNILQTKIILTVVNGKIAYSAKN